VPSQPPQACPQRLSALSDGPQGFRAEYGPLPAELWIALLAHLEERWVRAALEATVAEVEWA
jgi:hypothetical protein